MLLCKAAVAALIGINAHAAAGAPVLAKVELTPLFGDHAVLQRGPATGVWGTANPGEKVEVSVSSGITPANRICSYLESLRQQDGGYAYPGQDASHLSATYAAVMTHALLGRNVGGDTKALATLVAKGIHPVLSRPVESARTRWHWARLYEYRLQQVRILKALGENTDMFRREIDGYVNIERRWKKGDELIICFDMEPRTVRANNKVAADRGMISVERGPLVYCAEHPDNNFDIMGALINQNPQFRLGKGEIAGTPIQTLITDAQTLNFNKQGKLETSDQTLTLIPYYAWCHRGSGKMRVWLPQDLNATNPSQPATLASESKVSSSTEKMPALSAINDRLVPKDENDRSVPYTHWWPKNGSTEWLGYEFPEASTVQSATVYWYDDGPWGGCRVPQSWRILYQDAQGQWQPVSGADGYPTDKGSACTVNFDPVKTKALRLEVVLPNDNSAGLFEWIVK